MFDFFKKSTYLVDLLDGFCDVHSHLLPGVDDGSQSQKTTDCLADILLSMGWEKIYLTPHIIFGMYDSQDEKNLRARFAELNHFPKLEYRLAAEYMLDEGFLSHVESEEPMLTIGEDFLLVEYAIQSMRMGYTNELFETSMRGYNIIIAHPERYSFVANDPRGSHIDKMISCNHFLQLNLLSLCGYHGHKVLKIAEKMLLADQYTFLGSDVHSKIYTNTISRAKVPAKSAEHIKRLVENNRQLLWK